MYHWTDDMIRFMADASAYGDYHKNLAGHILPYLTGSEHICDAGCGLGDLSIALSPIIPKITAVDIKPQAAAHLREKCKLSGIGNVEILEGDIRQLPPETPYDAMIFCFFGMSEEILEIGKRQCCGRIISIKKNYCTHRFSAGTYPAGRDGFSRMRSIMKEQGIPFEEKQISLEFGQPFRCFEDVRAFFSCYSRDEDPSVLTDSFLQSKVIRTGRSDFPLYMPHQRQLGILVFESGDIP